MVLSYNYAFDIPLKFKLRLQCTYSYYRLSRILVVTTFIVYYEN